jgi:hypothetical protein
MALWDFIHGSYCLGLTSRPDRQIEARRELARVGLLDRTTFLLSPPADGPKPPAIFDSHCAAARDAKLRGFRRILIFEDDVCFLREGRSLAGVVDRTMARLPEGWQGLFLGHFPLRAFFIGPGILRTVSGCSHAYVANGPLIDWLAGLNPHEDLPARRIPLHRLVGQGIDAALAVRPGMYACFPMVAVQSASPSSNIDPHRNRDGSRRSALSKYRYTHIAIRSMRAAQWVAAFFSPLHWMTRRRWLPEQKPNQ